MNAVLNSSIILMLMQRGVDYLTELTLEEAKLAKINLEASRRVKKTIKEGEAILFSLENIKQVLLNAEISKEIIDEAFEEIDKHMNALSAIKAKLNNIQINRRRQCQ